MEARHICYAYIELDVVIRTSGPILIYIGQPSAHSSEYSTLTIFLAPGLFDASIYALGRLASVYITGGGINTAG